MSEIGLDDRVLVSPRYMAGAGDRIADVLGPLVRLFDWQHRQDAATGRVQVDSPDGSLFVDFAPMQRSGMWCTVSHHEPYWQAAFSRQAPLEAVAAVAQALPQLLGDTRHIEQIPLTDQPLEKLAALHGWTVEGTVITSPDWYCQLARTPQDDHAITWRVHHAFFEDQPLATFTCDVPERLVGNFFTHLASTAPVERAVADVPIHTRYGHSDLMTPVRHAVINPHTDHALAQLTRAMKRR
ncbi:DUF317 domain-containing protein [Streptomyces sp. cg28]|uniref:DUF317 domain-containing protein n=1 Tax=Streptomyces sp. cg28 TaxID=3403457 RepID=UPI003B21496C